MKGGVGKALNQIKEVLMLKIGVSNMYCIISCRKNVLLKDKII